MTLRISLLLTGLVLLAVGGHGLYHASRSRTQVSMSCEQFTGRGAPAVWVRLAGCELDYMGAAFRKARGRIAELYFPVRLPASSPTAPVRLVAATSDPAALAIAQETIGRGQQPDQEAFLVMMLRIVTALGAAREVNGTVRTSPLRLLSSRSALAGMSAALAPDVTVLDLNVRPTLVWPMLEASSGVMALLVFVVLPDRRRTAHGTAGATSLPAFMLLNLAEDATTADIEKAPALGPRDEVVRTIQTAVRGIEFAGPRGTLARRDVRITIDLGDTDVVWTAVVKASGRGAPASVRALARATGWRVFVPRRGTFVAAEGIDGLDRA